MFTVPLTKDEKAQYYSLMDGIGVKDIKGGHLGEKPDPTQLQQWLRVHNIDRMVADELGYHFKLLKVPSKPYILYTQGNKDILDMPLIGIVGPRKSSQYAQDIMKDFFSILSKYDVATVSGGAPGIDTLCHTLSLQYGIPTVVVLGGGLAYYQKKTSSSLLHDVIDQGGLLLSEFKLKQVPTSYTFPQRNRIIAGLSDVLFVPSAGQQSGSLITVDFALQIHTTVYTVPASLHEPMSMGSNQYLAEGKMKAVVHYEDMLDIFFEKKGASHEKILPDNFSIDQQDIISYLQEHGASSIDSLASHVGKTTSIILADITILEMYACIREERPGYYITV